MTVPVMGRSTLREGLRDQHRALEQEWARLEAQAPGSRAEDVQLTSVERAAEELVARIRLVRQGRNDGGWR